MDRFIEEMGMFGSIESPMQGQPIGKVPGLLLGDVVLIVMTALALLALFMFWARFLRNRKVRRKNPHAQRVYQDEDEDADRSESAADPAAEMPDSRRRYKYRWKRRKHRRRNPALSETGGLPSARADEAESP
ncbi:MAG: hypothetical protein O2960_18465 [Verrucomicrobia bacterium]|nr:hypothetical protein [Verrucomicrobiota bacterium]